MWCGGKCVHVYFYAQPNFYGRKAIPRMQQQEEAMAETEQMLDVYADFAENCMALPVIKGVKTPTNVLPVQWILIALRH